ncbi:MAG: glycosyltransferase [Bryobacteraceae bacterium]|jgi:glycosyltransferase involved in cell wall biosynthesis
MSEFSILHLTEHLCMGGTCAIMANDIRAATTPGVRRIMAGFDGQQAYASALARDGIEAYVTGDGLRTLSSRLKDIAPFAVVAHRDGEQTDVWNEVLPGLRRSGAVAMVERNIFGYADDGEIARQHLDKSFELSKHNLFRHWTASGRPALDPYLERNQVLYPCVDFQHSIEDIAARGRSMRKSLGIPEDAFVAGDLCRPAPKKLDYMVPAILPRVLRRMPNFYFVARMFPDRIERRMRAAVGPRFINLPCTNDRGELAGTYACLDVLLHMSTAGESFGMAIAEAMCCGVPIIANETPGSRENNAQGELVRHGETGFLANTPDAVLHFLSVLNSSPALRQKIGSAARSFFDSGAHSKGMVASQLEGELLSIARARGAALNVPIAPWQRCVPARELADYLVSYRAALSAPIDHVRRGGLWTIRVNVRRNLWRVEKKLQPHA